MSKVKIQGNASGTGIFTVAAPATNTDRTITLPDIQGTAVVADSNNRVGLGTSILPTDASLITSSGIKMNITNPGQRRVYALGQTSDNYTLNLSGGAAVLFDRISGSDEIAFETHYTGYWHREQMRITKEGYVKMPYQPAFKAGAGSTISVSGSTTAIPYSTDANTCFSIGNHYNSSNGIFTAPVAGRYIFTHNLLAQSMGGGDQLEVYVAKNGSLQGIGGRHNYQANYTGTDGYIAAAVTVIVNMAANDTASATWYRQGSSGTIHGNPVWSYFTGYLLG